MAVSLIAAHVARACILHVSTKDVPDGEIDEYDIAYLNGGAEQVFFSAIATLVECGTVELDSKERKLTIKDNQTKKQLHFVEQNLVNTIHWGQAATIDKLFDRFKPVTEKLKSRLQSMDLVAGGDREVFVTAIPMMILMALPIGLGIPRLLNGIYHNRPVSFLLILLLVSFVMILMSVLNKNKRTTLGDEALRILQKNHASLRANFSTSRHTLKPQDITLAYALFGGVLGGALISTLDPFNAAKAAMHPPVSGGGGGCGSSCGGGCGGGCGG